MVYHYPPSPSSTRSREESPEPPAPPLNARIAALQRELLAVEAAAKAEALSSPSVDHSGMLASLSQVRKRLEGVTLSQKNDRPRPVAPDVQNGSRSFDKKTAEAVGSQPITAEQSERRTLAEIDNRLNILENLVGATSTALDEVSTPDSVTTFLMPS